MPGAVRQPHIHDDEVRLEALGHRRSTPRRAGLGDDLELRAAVEHGDQALANDLVVVDHQERQRSAWAVESWRGDLLVGVGLHRPVAGSAIRVPVASLSMSMVAPTVATRERMLASPW